eukprot:m51a1_g4373 hypothetical protein (149) ;mRNA; f:314113-316608
MILLLVNSQRTWKLTRIAWLCDMTVHIFCTVTCVAGRLQSEHRAQETERALSEAKRLLERARRQLLEVAKEAANLLVMDKGVLVDAAAVRDTFPRLHAAKVYSIVKNFHADDFGKKPADSSKVDAVAQHLRQCRDPPVTVLDPRQHQL